MENLDPNQTNQSSRQAFAQLIAPLEASAQERLAGGSREACFRAFVASPRGVESVVNAVLADREVRRPIAVFVHRIVKEHQHEFEAAAADEGGELARALRWAARTGRLLEEEHREDELARFRLNPQEAAQVRAVLLPPARRTYDHTCVDCHVYPCHCEEFTKDAA